MAAKKKTVRRARYRYVQVKSAKVKNKLYRRVRVKAKPRKRAKK